MFENLRNLALGHLEDVTLAKTMTNLESLRKVVDDFENLKKELFKRIYGDIESMGENEKENLKDFFSMLSNNANVANTYPNLYKLRQKEVSVIVSLLNKDVEVDVEPVDKNLFVAGIIKGNKDAKVVDVVNVFAPLFEPQDEKITDVSELDEFI